MLSKLQYEFFKRLKIAFTDVPRTLNEAES
jgi:hypothetical protein